MSNDLNQKETVNVLLVYLLQLQYLAIQSIENKNHDLLVKNNGNEKLSKMPKTSEKSSELPTISKHANAKKP
ncbi:34171_t:CDS:1, partial [Racocetra persica]